MNVRRYKPEDSEGVRNLILAILKKEYPFGEAVYKDSDISDISGTYNGEDNAFFVAEEKGRVAGTVGIKRETRDSALLRRLFVDRNYRKKGFGTALLKKALEFASECGYKELVFRATDRMRQAMDLCKKMGFLEKEDLEVSVFHIHKFVKKL